MSDWRKVSTKMTRLENRKGWLGKWDWLVSKLLRKPQYQQNVSYRASAHISGKGSLEITEGLKVTMNKPGDGLITLVHSPELTIICDTCDGDGEIMRAILLPSGHSERMDTCPDCDGEGMI